MFGGPAAATAVVASEGSSDFLGEFGWRAVLWVLGVSCLALYYSTRDRACEARSKKTHPSQ